MKFFRIKQMICLLFLCTCWRMVVHAEPNLVTRVNDWIVNLHLTSVNQLEAGIGGGEAAQNTFAYGIDPLMPDVHLFGTNTNGIYRSTDGGETWCHSSTGLNTGSVSTIAFLPGQPQVVFATLFCGNKLTALPAGVGIYKSVDGGVSWRQVQNAPYILKRGAENIAFFNDGTGMKLYAVTYRDGIYVSDDVGESWRNIGYRDLDFNGILVSGNRIFAYGAFGMLYSDDGVQFNSVQEDGLPEGAVVSVAADKADGTHLLCIAANCLYETNNLGESWTAVPVESGFSARNELSYLRFGPVGTDGISRLYLSINASVYNVRVSTDGGRNFTSPTLDCSLAPHAVTGYFADAFCPHPTNPDIVMSSFNTVIFKSVDGGLNYRYSSSGVSGFVAKKIYFNEAGELTYMGFVDKGLGKFSKHPLSPYPVYTQLPTPGYGGYASCTEFDVDPLDENKIVFITGNGGYTGATCVAEMDVLTGESRLYEDTADLGISNVFFHRTNPDIIYAGWRISYDRGQTWQPSQAYAYACSKLDGDVVWGFFSSHTANRELAISTDGGRSWSGTGKIIYEPISVVQDVANTDWIWIAARGALKYNYRTGEIKVYDETNGLVRGAYRVLQVRCIAQDPEDPEHLLLSMRDSTSFSLVDSLFETYNGGQYWYPVEQISRTVGVDYITFAPNEKRAYMGSAIGVLIYDYPKYAADHKDIFSYLNNFEVRYPYAGEVQIFGRFDDITTSVPFSVQISQVGGQSFLIDDVDFTRGIVYVNQFEMDNKGIQLSLPLWLEDQTYLMRIVRQDNGMQFDFVLHRDGIIRRGLFYDQEGRLLQDLQPTQDVLVKYSFYNLSSAPRDVSLLLALYDGDALVKVYPKAYTIPSIEQMDLTCALSELHAEHPKLKAYLWDMNGGYIPLVSASELRLTKR